MAQAELLAESFLQQADESQQKRAGDSIGLDKSGLGVRSDADASQLDLEGETKGARPTAIVKQ